MKILRIISAFLILRKSFGQVQLSNCVLAPDLCPNPNITFWLYTRATQEDPQELNVADPQSIRSAKFAPNVPFSVLIHGYTGHKDFSPNSEIRPAYFQRGEHNVISVDWNPLAQEPCYFSAAENVRMVGKCSAQLIDTLVQERGIALEKFHVIGFSLGGQAAGAVSHGLKSGRLERVTGLDPAMPLFVTTDTNSKLDKSDAKFVDVIHTNALDKGKLEACGHVDFYVNGGMNQPGCKNNDVNMTTSGCNHWRAPVYYAESINSETGFYGMKCSSWFLFMLGWCEIGENTDEVIMGEYTPSTAEGLYFVDTNSEAPFAKGTWAEQQQKSNITTPDQPEIANPNECNKEKCE